MPYLKNIIKIEIAEADALGNVTYPAPNLCVVPQNVEFRQIQVKNPSSCEITDKVESKVRIFTTKLTFKTCEQLMDNGSPLAYKLTAADGICYLMGSDHRPFPVLTRSENMPSSFTETSLITYTVTWSDVVKPLQIIE